MRAFLAFLISIILAFAASAQPQSPNERLYSKNKGGDPDADFNAIPIVPEGFEVTLVAKEPLVRNPCAIAFDGQGRMFIGQGPQYRRMMPDSPKDSVYLLIDDDNDGIADSSQLYATGFNGIQGLAWRGGDLYIANAPDLTIVRDLDGDDMADEYVKLYTDLGNIEHALHGLNFAPDGRLYMSKGNSKGLSLPGRVAPKAFRDLFGIDAPEGSPDIPPPQVFTVETYEATFHDPNDDWGRMGGILRANPDGSDLEILSYGARNPWDINFSDSFDWLGADNDQTEGDRFFRPFLGAHVGWNHSWSTDWTGADNLPTAPAIMPLVDGSTTGVAAVCLESLR
ncbi:MAG: PVC-type heme-binding CxxCH protein [Verrucomicrobiota bacterium]|nr:PVC-type heme-binding CxxCH protein [Verrucomicrobiota bacterium]